ncbi:MAG: GAF domain-containing protein, partial [Nitrospinae bacterium]|nr:GAF domain-containing protein [Nitrospinota bacterium]
MTPSNIILGHLIDLIGNVADAYTCALFTTESSEKELVLSECFTLSRNLDRGAKIAFGEGPIGKAAQTRKTQLIENLDQNTRFLRIYNKNEDLKSFMALPVIYGDQVAVLSIDTKERYQFSVKLQKILSEFTQQIAWNLEASSLEQSTTFEPVFQEINSYCRLLAESPDRSSIADRLTQIP